MDKLSGKVPNYDKFINPTLRALQTLGGSGRIDEIDSEAVKQLGLPESIIEIPHGNGSRSEVEYRLAWARTFLKKYGVIENSARGVWSIKPEHTDTIEVDVKKVMAAVREASKQSRLKKNEIIEENENDDSLFEFSVEEKTWKDRLYEILVNMDAFAFERLSKLLLRECGFTQVNVTKKSGDGGIDGTGKLKINGVFSFNIAFQCKRYKETSLIPASAIRDFRGSLTTDIEKGVFITTSKFSNAAKEEATNPGKQQIDLMDGDEFMNKLAEYAIGVKEVKDYEIDESYFSAV